MEENTEDFIGIKDREKMIIIYNFSEDMKNILKSFFSAHGFFILIGESIHGVIQHCREHVLFLICIYVDGYDTSWIRIITSMTIDPLVYEAPVLICCKDKYLEFFKQQQPLFHYSLLSYPPSYQQFAQLLRDLQETQTISMTLKRKERVLCVDDSSETLDSLQFCLKKFGFQVDTFLSSQQALQHMKSHWNYDIAIINLVMPEMSGFDLMVDMKNDPHLFLIPIIILSSSTDVNHIEKCLVHGASEYLMKPVSYDMLRLRMERVIQENKTYRTIYHNQLAQFPLSSVSFPIEDQSVHSHEQQSQGYEKIRKKNHQLKQQNQELLEEKVEFIIQIAELQYEIRSLRKLLAQKQILPPILLHSSFLANQQQQEIEEINRFFGNTNIQVYENGLLKELLLQLKIPSILHYSLLRDYYDFIHFHDKIEFSNTICNTALIDSIEKECFVIEKQSFQQYWISHWIGKSTKDRIVHFLPDYQHIKQVIADYLVCTPSLQHNCSSVCQYITTVSLSIIFDLTGFSSFQITHYSLTHSNLTMILTLLDTKPINMIIPFAPTYTQQIITRFYSLCFESESIPCPSFHSLSVSFEKLMTLMNPLLTSHALQRSIWKINQLFSLNCNDCLFYEGYVIFNLLYTDAMQGKSMRFWFDVIDGDDDGVLSQHDVIQCLKDTTYDEKSQTMIWIELCDMCDSSIHSTISFKQFKLHNAGQFCFQHIILQSNSYIVCWPTLFFILSSSHTLFYTISTIFNNKNKEIESNKKRS